MAEAGVKEKEGEEADINDWLKIGLPQANEESAKADEGKEESKEGAEEETKAKAEDSKEAEAKTKEEPKAKEKKVSPETADLVHQLAMERAEDRKEMKALLEVFNVTAANQTKIMEALSAQNAKKNETPEEKELRIAKDREEFEKDPVGFLQRELEKARKSEPEVSPKTLTKEQKEELAKSNGFDNYTQMEISGISARNWRDMESAVDSQGEPIFPLMKEDDVRDILADKAFLKEVALFLKEDGETEVDVVKKKSFYKLAYDKAVSRYEKNKNGASTKAKQKESLDEAGAIEPGAGSSGKPKTQDKGDAFSGVESAWKEHKSR